MTKILNTISWILLIIATVLCIVILPQLPDQIPIHFNLKGMQDRVGSKYSLIILPLLFTGVFLLLHFIKKRAVKFNYPGKIVPENQAYQYRLITGMLIWVQFASGFVLLLLLLLIRQVALHNRTGLGSWFIIFVISIYTIPSLIYIVLAFRKLSS